jgi:hypothetical protein
VISVVQIRILRGKTSSTYGLTRRPVTGISVVEADAWLERLNCFADGRRPAVFLSRETAGGRRRPPVGMGDGAVAGPNPD